MGAVPADRSALLFSVSKSFTSMAIGLLVDAGLLSLDDQVVSFFEPDELPETISDNLAAMKVRHLLTMTTGHRKDTVERLSRDRRMVRSSSVSTSSTSRARCSSTTAARRTCCRRSCRR